MIKTKNMSLTYKNIPSFIYGCSEYNDNIDTLVLVVLIVMIIDNTFEKVYYHIK